MLPTEPRWAQPLSSEDDSTALRNRLTNFVSCFNSLLVFFDNRFVFFRLCSQNLCVNVFVTSRDKGRRRLLLAKLKFFLKIPAGCLQLCKPEHPMRSGAAGRDRRRSAGRPLRASPCFFELSFGHLDFLPEKQKKTAHRYTGRGYCDRIRSQHSKKQK